MGNIARHTDLSWEAPGLRADVELPLEFLIRRPGILPGTRLDWHGARDHGASDAGAERPWDLEGFQQL